MFVMARGMMLGIRARAERADAGIDLAPRAAGQG
jgi:hypothetical protein